MKSPLTAAKFYICRMAYRAWQSWIRELSPEKPVLIGSLWALLRPMKGTKST